MPKLYEYFGLIVQFYSNEHEPILIICLLIYLTGYILVRYHFSRKRESFRRSMIVNITVLVLWMPFSEFTVFALHFLCVVSAYIY